MSSLEKAQCLEAASKEHVMLKRAIQDALRAGEKPFNMTEEHGCDSSANGAFLLIDLPESMTSDRVFRRLMEKGWSLEARRSAAPGNRADLAKGIGKRIIGIRLTERGQITDSKSPSPERLVVQAIDDCWGERYLCQS
ncbi:hypothetical protein OUY22_35175 [Nonomuraea sp. MCN248]|uniref:Uncharacterized protein n=1 Tax=Nonomuraea corallina TaxID=2989783 RepID=A0ABT4SP66_9ACTN|nr:hypothetical protein [Nonomuraea corallina]MDA0638681.1 hypothetical protein [Nonomuraea corallina]